MRSICCCRARCPAGKYSAAARPVCEVPWLHLVQHHPPLGMPYKTSSSTVHVGPVPAAVGAFGPLERCQAPKQPLPATATEQRQPTTRCRVGWGTTCRPSLMPRTYRCGPVPSTPHFAFAPAHITPMRRCLCNMHANSGPHPRMPARHAPRSCARPGSPVTGAAQQPAALGPLSFEVPLAAQH